MDEPSATTAVPPLRRRREILQGIAALVASGWLPASSAQTAPAALSAARFAAMSSTLTGYAYTDPALTAAVLSALNTAVGAAALAKIATLASVIAPDQLDAVLRIAGLQQAAATVITTLFSGTIETPKGTVVLTYDRALAWNAVPWTKPNAQCGGMTDYWAAAPELKKT